MCRTTITHDTASPVLVPPRLLMRVSLCCQGILADLDPLLQCFSCPTTALCVLCHCNALLRRRSHLHREMCCSMHGSQNQIFRMSTIDIKFITCDVSDEMQITGAWTYTAYS